jgi:hypothetical protein
VGERSNQSLMYIRSRLICGLLCILGTLSSTGSVSAQQRPSLVFLYWTRYPGAESCLDQHALEQSIEGRLNRKVFTSQRDADLIVQGEINRVDVADNWRVSFTMRDSAGNPLGERNVIIQARDCRNIDDAISLVFTLMVESLRETTFVQPTPNTPPAKRAPSKPEEPIWDLDIEPALAASFGLLPQPAFGFTFEASLTAKRFVRSLIAISLFQPTRASEQSVGADIDSWNIETGGCLNVLSPSSFRLEGCVGLEFGQMRAYGVNMNVQRNPQRWAIGALLGPSFTLELSSYFILRLDLLVQVPIRSARFYYVEYLDTDVAMSQKRTLWQPWSVIPLVRFGLGIRLL